MQDIFAKVAQACGAFTLQPEVPAEFVLLARQQCKHKHMFAALAALTRSEDEEEAGRKPVKGTRKKGAKYQGPSYPIMMTQIALHHSRQPDANPKAQHAVAAAAAAGPSSSSAPEQRRESTSIITVSIQIHAVPMLMQGGVSLYAGAGAYMGVVLHHLLRYGRGLWVGPDSDGLLNFCDEQRPKLTPPSAPHGVGLVADGAAAGPSGKAGDDGAGAGPSTAAAAGALTTTASAACGSSGASGSGQTAAATACTPLQAVTQIPSGMRDVPSLLASVTQVEAMAEAPAPADIRSTPKHYQLQGLQWMLGRERDGDAVGRGVVHLDPQHVQLVTESGHVMYVHR